MKKDLWVISELYYPETNATGHILTQIAEGLSESFEVNVICSQPSYWERGIKAPSRELHNDVRIHRVRATTLNKNILLLRLINLITVTVSLFFTTLFLIKPDNLVLVVTNPPALPFAIMLACRVRRAKCSLLVHDVYPDVAVAVGKLKENSPITKLLTSLSTQLYHHMECIYVIGRDMQVKIADKLKSGKERVIIATNWADIDIVHPEERCLNALLKELGLLDKFVLLYAGNFGYPNDIECILEAAEMLRNEKDIHFLFIGSGAKEHLVRKSVEQTKLCNITILPNRPRSEQNEFLNACDMSLISLVNGMKGVSVPSRTYNTLASGKAIMAIVEKETEVALLVEEEQVGWVVDPGQPDKLAKTILEAKCHPELLAFMGNRASQIARSKYHFERSLQIFKSTLSTI